MRTHLIRQVVTALEVKCLDLIHGVPEEVLSATLGSQIFVVAAVLSHLVETDTTFSTKSP